MRTVGRTAISALSSVFLIGSAVAADLTGAQLKELFSGKSVYLENTATSTAGAGQGVIYYAADGTALYKTGSGKILHGTWTIKENTACIDWKEQPNNPCTRYDKQGDTITSFNVATGQPRGKVLKIVDGNAEKIAP
ncbi:MAG: hypothetical protein M3O82_05415 [Verrucomicrobiota bacterium]|nr:hypothetical protein [Verrucomicrobiota bacterium]